MIFLWYLLAFAISILSGHLLVRYLTTSPKTMSACLVGLLFSLVGLGLVLWQVGPSTNGFLALLLALPGFAAGYLITNALFLRHEEDRRLPEIQAGSGSRGHTAVIYLTHGEPPAYSSAPWVETFKEFDQDKVPFIPVPFRPFFFYLLRQKYLTFGGSPHNDIHQDMLNSLVERFRQDGDQSTRFYLAFLDSDPRPDEAAIRAINDGAARLIVANVFLTLSSHTQAGLAYLDALDLRHLNIKLRSTQPLWNSDALKQMFVERANQHVQGTDKSKVGILLVGHGQPDSWDQRYPTQTQQENLFRQSVMDRLVKDGFQPANISLAWMEFKEPNTTHMARVLGSQGITKLLVFAASISATSIHSQYDIPDAVRRAGLPASVQVVNLGAWDNDPRVIQAIYEEIKSCAPEVQDAQPAARTGG